MVNAVICEFDPFHNGHKYLLSAAKERTGADATVCFMSGNFVQRGSASVCEKHFRAAAAVRHGADLVIQIPTAHTLSGAAVFADAGVQMADALGVPVSLCFGTQSEDMTPLFRLALTDKDKLNREFRRAIDGGVSYGTAVMRAYAACSQDAGILKNPNDLLAFEYIKAIIARESKIKVVNIPRIGSGHGEPPRDGYASASYIREHPEEAAKYMPEPPVFRLDRSKLDVATMFAVSQKSAEELLRYADMGGGFNNRVYAAARKARTTEELYALIKNKRYTMSRIRRAITGVLIGNPAGLYRTPVPYLKVLAFNDAGRQLLKTLHGCAALPVITKPAAVKELTCATEHAMLEERASDIYNFCLENGRSGREYTVSPVYVGKDAIE